MFIFRRRTQGPGEPRRVSDQVWSDPTPHPGSEGRTHQHQADSNAGAAVATAKANDNAGRHPADHEQEQGPASQRTNS